jgi:predicted homoserine dehydrogenase-like protein
LSPIPQINPRMTSLSTKLAALKADGKPIQVGIIGAGKFGSML